MTKTGVKTNKKEKIAKVIRTATVPPVMVSLLLIILYRCKQGFFGGIYEVLLSALFLAVIPIAAYPLQPLIPKYKDKGREGQRNLAFTLSFAGYTAAILYGVLAGTSKELLLIFATYFLSILILLIFNKIIKFRSSGHACSISGPLIVLVYFMGWKIMIPCVILFGVICWASLVLKRHTAKELIGGCISCSIAFAIAFISIIGIS